MDPADQMLLCFPAGFLATALPSITQQKLFRGLGLQPARMPRKTRPCTILLSEAADGPHRPLSDGMLGRTEDADRPI